MYIEGLRTKTINIFTSVSSTKFRLQNNNELGLPDGAKIVGIQARTPTEEGRVSNGRDMVDLNFFEESFLFLKVRDENGKIDLLTQQYYLPDLVDNVLFLEPTTNYLIDWNESYIEIKETALPFIKPTSSFEIVVHYTMNCDIYNLKNKLTFRSGAGYIGKRNARFEIALNNDQSIYRISNTQNIGLPDDAIILGFNTVQPKVPLTQGIAIGTAIDSTFLTIKKKQNSFVDAYPVALNQTTTKVFPEITYFPIEPIPVLEIDWSQSFLQIFNANIPIDGQVFSYNIIWCKP